MARQPRMHEIGDIHHVMSHAVEHLNLFESAVDFFFFLDVLDQYFTQYECHCYGFALMPNHYHLIVRPSGDKEQFSKMMQCINTKLAGYVNSKQERQGPVFWGRFKSIPTRDIEYIRNLILYVHANPLKGGMVSDLATLCDYRWCSHSYLFMEKSRYPWLKTNFMKSQLGLADGNIVGYLAGLSQYCSEPFDPWYYDKKRKRPMPTVPKHARGEESAWVMSKILEVEKERIFRVQLHKQSGILQRLLRGAKEHFGVASIWDKHSKNSTNAAFNVFSYWAVMMAGYSGALIARMLGCDPNTVLRAARKGETEAAGVPFPIGMEDESA